MFSKTEVKYKIEEKNYQPKNRGSIFLNNLTIKIFFILFASITASFNDYERVGLRHLRN